MVMDAVGMSAGHLVGNSVGAAIARVAAVEHPERVLSITLVGPGLDGTPVPPESAERARRWRQAVEAGDVEAAVAVAGEMWIGGGADEALLRDRLARPRVEADMTPRDPEAYAPEKVRRPALVVVGDGDDDTVQLASRALAGRIEGAHLAVIEGARHHPQLDQPVHFCSAVLGFLGGLGSDHGR